MQSDTREKLRNRLKRIAGQVAGLQKMVEEDVEAKKGND